ncbi:MAG: sulfite exporter TauE/SafE family protein [Candidatus Aenigmarchaeota archaeon]|nr:sulfite exporter TauE/SafE family protein [Candidatus Aenigmarchaeota archaeon]
MIEFFVLIFLAGFIMEYVDSTLGGGYGTVLTPLFLLLGYTAPTIVPMILLSEILTGMIGGFWHKRFGNVDKKAVSYVAPFAIVGTMIAIVLAITISKFWINLYIGLLVSILGVFMFIKYYRGKNKSDDPKKIRAWRLPLIGGLIGFNKGLTGGGFGPVSTAGLSWVGYEPRKSVGSTALSEGIVCLVGFIGYWSTKGIGTINWTLAIPLIFGAILATYPAACTTTKIPRRLLGILVAITVMLLGLGVLVNLPGW